MPTRSSSSSVLVWPDRQVVDQAARAWAAAMTQRDPRIVRIGYFGSYARGDWGVGSDLDLVIVVTDSEFPWEQRAAAFDTTGLPVPVDLIVYTEPEWRSVVPVSRFGTMLRDETVWLSEGLGS